MFPLKTLGRNLRKALLEPEFALNTLLKRNRALLSYSFKNSGKAPLPESLTLFLTNKCNLRCNMCGQWGEEGASRSFAPGKVNEKLDPAIYFKLLDEVKACNPHITLFGGEPLLYEEFEELVRGIKQRKMHLGLITNGLLLKEHAETIVDAGVDVVSLSVDGPEEIHDRVRNLEGAFRQVKAGAEEIARLKKEKNSLKPLVNIVCTISELNYKGLKEMPAVAKELRAGSLNLHHLIFIEAATLETHNKYFLEKFGAASTDWSGFVRTAYKGLDPEKLANDIYALKAGKYPFLFTVYPDFSKAEIIEYYTAEDFVSKAYPGRCLSPWINAYIYPNGDVQPCQGLGFIAGNINEEPFQKIWNGEKFRAFRQELKKQKYFKVCPKCTEMYRY